MARSHQAVHLETRRRVRAEAARDAALPGGDGGASASASSSSGVLADELADLSLHDVALRPLRSDAAALRFAHARLAAELASCREHPRPHRGDGLTRSTAVDAVHACADEQAKDADAAHDALGASLTRLEAAIDAHDGQLGAALEVRAVVASWPSCREEWSDRRPHRPHDASDRRHRARHV